MAGLENMPLVCGSNRLPNKKPQNKTKSPSCRHSVQPQKFVEVIPRKLFKQSSKKRCVGKSGPLERIREEGAKQWTTHFPIPGSPIRASGSMLREAFSLLETKGVEQKCSSSLTVHLGHRPAPYGQYDTTWQRTSMNKNFRRGRHHLTLGNKRTILTWVLVEGFEWRKRHSWNWREHLGMVSGEEYPRSKRGVFQSYFPFLLLFPRSSPHYWNVTSDFSLCTSVPYNLAS